MGTDVTDVKETLPNRFSFKVHSSMCTELLNLVDRIESKFPEIEAARPRCSSGIQALCSLKGAIERSNKLLLYCCECSKLYSAITGDAILSRCQKSRDLLEQSLSQIHTMVPINLADEISIIIDDLQAATFMLDSYEDGAGKAIRKLLHLGTSADPVENSEISALQLAASRLNITSPKAILVERRAIRKLLDNVGDTDPKKKKILKYLWYLLKKYGDKIKEDNAEKPDIHSDGPVTHVNSSDHTVYDESANGDMRTGNEHSKENDLPAQFICPISMRIMTDPVVIASGQTYERACIQKWFDEGHDTCPKTNTKLSHLSLTPNTAMKELILRWSAMYGVTVPDPRLQKFQQWEFSSASIASLGSSMNDLHLPSDISSISLGSTDNSYTDSMHMKFSGQRLVRKKDDLHLGHNVSEVDLEILFTLNDLDWESQCKLVEDTKSHLNYNDGACHSLSSQDYVEPLLCFLRGAWDQCDSIAQRSGLQLLLALVSKNSNAISYLHNDAFDLLATFLDSEASYEALPVLEVLSGHPCCRTPITSSGALDAMTRILNSQNRELQESAIKILHNLSVETRICSQIVSMECIPSLVPLINDDSVLADYCIMLLKNFCQFEDARTAIAATEGCISSIVRLLDSTNLGCQENALAILLSLCSQHIRYCCLVMDEGVIPSLVYISSNGSEKGRARASELLRQLRDTEFTGEDELVESQLESSLYDSSRDGTGDVSPQQPKEERSSSKAAGFLKMTQNLFSKSSPKRKR